MEGRIDPPSSLHRLSAADITQQAESGEIWLIGHEACLFLTPRPDMDPPALYLGKLAVHPDAQGKGHARALIDLAEQRARDMDLPRLALKTRIELVENHKIFTRLGFKKTGESCHPGYDRVTSYEFSKEV
ncbi:GNAT family N-acetyltransferase [Aliiroseovarius sp. PrR006]|nr:GNAT family N-acetyltransferase [Aliiroseovarius sp. PrR006]NDW54727.1 GNAT family N-acetyltransferase [Aliiroseovarius sp. PrR006]